MAKFIHFHHSFFATDKDRFWFWGSFWWKYQDYSLTFWPKIIHFNLSFFSTDKDRFWFWGSFWWKYQDYSLTFWPNASIFITLFSQLTKRGFDFGAIFDENTKTMALLFGQMHPFSSLFLLNWHKEVLILGQFLMKIPRLWPYFLAKSIHFHHSFFSTAKGVFWFWGNFSWKYQDYSLTFWPKIIQFHHSFFSTDIKRFWFWGSFWWKYQDYSLTFWPKASIFITLFSQLTKIDFDFGAIFHENTKTIALLFGQKHPFSSLFFLNWQREVLILGQFLMKIPRL